MNQQEKQLLLKDLSARLPYGVIVHEEWEYQNPGVKERTKKEEDHIMNCYDLASITTIKPYLRPMSSMTEEEREELSHYENSVQRTDFFYAHHIDCRFLIEKGLALEATEGMYND